MADRETGLNIPVGAYADEKSAEKAVKDIAKKVDSSLKDGHIEIPVELKAPLKGVSSDIIKAQEDVIQKWEAASKKGFSSSTKEAKELIEAYTKFKKLIGQSHKNRMQQFKNLDAFMGEKVQTLRNERSAKKATKKEFSQTDINKALKESKRQYDERRKEKRKYDDIKSALPRGYKKDTGVDTGVATSRTLIATEYGGSYEVKGARQAAISEAKARKEDERTLKVRQNKEEAERLADEAKIKGRNKNQFTDAERLKGIASAILPELANILGGIEKGVPNVSTDKFFEMMKAILTLNQEAGISTLKNVKSEIDMVLHKYFNTKGIIGVGNDKDKAAGTKNPQVVEALQGLLKEIELKEDQILKEIIEAQKLTKREQKSTSSKKSSGIEPNSIASRIINQIANTDSAQEIQLTQLANTAKQQNEAVETQTNFDKIENSAERNADRKAVEADRSISSGIKEDLGTGFNTDSKANELISVVREILGKVTDVLSVLSSKNTEQLTLPEGQKIQKSLSEIFKEAVQSGLSYEQAQQKIADISNQRKGKNRNPQNDVSNVPPKLSSKKEPEEKGFFSRSVISTSVKDPANWFVKLKDSIARLIGVNAEYEKVIAATSKEQDDLMAESIKKYGFARGRDISGDKIDVARSMALWRGTDSKRANEIFKDLKVTKGIEIDTTAVTDAFGKILAGNQMRNAQMGGSPLRQLVGYATGFAGVPSLEKSRALADAMNQMNANLREALNNTINTITDKESALKGMEDSGDLQLGPNGEVLASSSIEAKKLAAELENAKLILASILADAGMVDEVIEKTGGNFSKMVKQLSFTSPMLKDNNSILNNINAGYDKSGKALKFQTRTAEILNYSFQLMSRHVGQILKNWALMVNPINLIRKAFSDFSSYDTKWQRTMNVIKYNLRSIVKPIVEWVAQKLVNVIGVIDIISQKIQKAFGSKKVTSLFDQSAANAEKMKEELEAAANVTAGFDELHDIGSDNTGANDLLGDIYTPQLSEGWKKFAGVLGDLLAGIAKAIKWCIDNWKLFASLLAAFAIGKALWDLFGGFKGLSNILSNLPSLISKIGWGSLMNGAAWASAIAGSLIDAYYTWKMISKWGGMTPNERQKTGDKGIKAASIGWGGFGALKGFKQGVDFAKTGAMSGHALLDGLALGTLYAEVTSGLAKAASAGLKTGFAFWKGDTETMNHFAVEVGEGVGQAGGAVAGMAMGSVIGGILGGPVGASIGKILGSVVGGFAGTVFGEWLGKGLAEDLNKISDWFFGTGTFQKLKVSLDDVKAAEEAALKATDDYYSSLDSLNQLEQQYGISGKEVNDMIENGTLKLTELTPEQYKVYKAYQDMIDMQEKMKESLRQQLEVDAKWAEQQGKKANDFIEYISILEQGVQQGNMTHDEMLDHFSQTYAKLNEAQRKVFIEQLPENMRESIELGAEKYYTGWNKFKDKASKLLTLGCGIFVTKINDLLIKPAKEKLEAFANFVHRIVDNVVSYFKNIKAGWDQNGFSGAVKAVFGKSYETTQVASFAVGTNYVPSDGLAYLHQGESVIPKKYNQPYQPAGMSQEEKAYMERMMSTMSSLDNTMKQGINVSGEFRQRGSDLVAVTERAKNRNGHQPLNNPVFAR